MIVILARFRINEGKEKEALEAMRTMAQRVQEKEPGCLAYVSHRPSADPSEIVFYEVYENDAALGAHGASEHMQAFRQSLPELVDVTQIKLERLDRLDGFVREGLLKAT